MVREAEELELEVANLDEGVREGVRYFQVPAERLNVQVVEERKRSLLWRAGGRYRLRIGVKPPDVDGTFTVRLDGRDCLLTVTPPQGDGRRVLPGDVDEVLADWPLERRDHDVVRAIVDAATGAPAVCGHLHVPGGLPEDQPFFVVVTLDRMRAYVFPRPPEEDGALPAPTVGAVMESLRDAGVTFGLNESAVQRFVEQDEPWQPLLVARGVPAEDGQHAAVVYLFRESLPLLREEAVDQKERVNYREFFSVETAEEGQVLARKEPATAGRAGMDVLGRTIPHTEGQDTDLNRLVGKGADLGPDGNTIVAALAGRPTLLRGRVTVTPVYTVDGDVDFSTSNVDFHGSVVVTGNVLAGFRVRAGGDISVKGFVEAADLEAEGDVVIKGGVNGRGSGEIRAGGDVRARFIDWANIRAGRAVIAENELLRSNVIAREAVVVQGAGTLAGGVVRAGRYVQAKTLGSDVGVTTRVLVGPDALPRGFDLGTDSRDVPSDAQVPDSVVAVRGTVYPGTVVRIRGAGMDVTAEMVFARFYYDDLAKKVAVGPLR